MYFPHRFEWSVVSFKQPSVKYEAIMPELPHHWWILTAVRVDWKNRAARERLHLFSRLLTRRSLAILKWNEADSSSYCSVWAPVFQRCGLVKTISWSLSFRRMFIDVFQMNGSAWRFSPAQPAWALKLFQKLTTALWQVSNIPQLLIKNNALF